MPIIHGLHHVVTGNYLFFTHPYPEFFKYSNPVSKYLPLSHMQCDSSLHNPGIILTVGPLIPGRFTFYNFEIFFPKIQ